MENISVEVYTFLEELIQFQSSAKNDEIESILSCIKNDNFLEFENTRLKRIVKFLYRYVSYTENNDNFTRALQIIEIINNLQLKFSEFEISRNKDLVKKYFDNKQYKKAVEICKKMINQNIYFLEILTEINFINKKFSEALVYCKQGLAINKTVELLYLNCKILYKLEDYKRASISLAILKKMVPTDYIKDISVNIFDVTGLEIETALALENFENAQNLINGIISKNGAISYPAILLAYAKVCLITDNFSAGLTALLNLITVDSKNQSLKDFLLEIFQNFKNIQLLKNEVKNKSNNVSIYNFIGGILKDGGKIDLAINLYRESLTINPILAESTLSLMHSVEITGNFEEVIRIFINFTNNIPENYNLRELLIRLNSIIFMKEFQILKITHLEEDNYLKCNDETYLMVNNQIPDFSQIQKIKYSTTELSILAICCTLVKIFYQQGKLQILPYFFEVIEPFRIKALQELHQSNIRNEIAYYQIIGQILSYSDKCEPPLDGLKPIYICGDSHSLSPSWKTIKVNGEDRILVPKLCTGVKHWHLTNQSNFYTKINFSNLIKSLPNKSEIILVIGEIDCRESLKKSVEKDCYENLTEAMENNINSFIDDTLKPLIKKKNLKIYLHPIVPALDPTREIVIAYNKIYQELTSKIPELVWLDFFDDLLTDSLMLKEEYKMDLIHLNPTYVKLIEKSLN